MPDRALLRVENLCKSYQPTPGWKARPTTALQAVKNVSFNIKKGECLALIGESGSGKSTLGKCLLRLVPAESGHIWYKGQDLLALSERRFRRLRPKFQIIFQNPLLALNPRQEIGKALMEPLCIYGKLSKRQALHQVAELVETVGLDNTVLGRYPRELSGGQRQRVTIARALSVEPLFLVADEPTSSLDASVRKQVIALLRELQEKLGLSLLLISHDLSMVHEVADRIAVMFKGEIVELRQAAAVVQQPEHPYTELLLRSAIHDVAWMQQHSKGTGLPL